MSVVERRDMAMMSIEECQRLDPPLRSDLEVLDYEIRRLVARIRSEATDGGDDDLTFVKASATVLLTIAAGLVARAAQDGSLVFEPSSFAASADNAAKWAREARLRYSLAGEA